MNYQSVKNLKRSNSVTEEKNKNLAKSLNKETKLSPLEFENEAPVQTHDHKSFIHTVHDNIRSTLTEIRRQLNRSKMSKKIAIVIFSIAIGLVVYKSVFFAGFFLGIALCGIIPILNRKINAKYFNTDPHHNMAQVVKDLNGCERYDNVSKVLKFSDVTDKPGKIEVIHYLKSKFLI